MRLLVVTYCFLMILSGFSQAPFYQDIFNGGVTSAGFSTGLGSGSGSFDIYVEPGSTVKKAFLFQYRHHYPDNFQPFYLNGVEYITDTLNKITEYSIFGGSLTNPTILYYWDVTDELNPLTTTYNIDLPMLPTSTKNVFAAYRAVYLVVCYENAALPEVAVNIVASDIDITGRNKFYNIENMNPINTFSPVGLSLFTDRAEGGSPWDGENVFINTNFIGLVYGSQGVDAAWISGARGSFYYQNNLLFALDDDVANATMDRGDALADISSYLSNNDTSYDLLLEYNSNATAYNDILLFVNAYTTPCSSFATSINTTDTLCYGESMPLLATGGTSYSWYPATGLSNATIANPVASPTETTTYICTITNAAGCKKTEMVRVTVDKPLNVANVSTTTSICGEDGAEVSISAMGGRSPYTYSVENESGSVVASNTTGAFTGIYAGNHTINIEDDWGCTTTQNITIDSVLLATANFTATPTFGKAPLKVRLTNESTNTTNYEWYVYGELQATTRNWETVLSPSGSYELMLVTYNKHPQCADTLWRTIHAFDSAQIIIPNVFTPNDDGLNDQFSVTTFGVKKIHYQIYNRYEKLFTEGELATSLEQGKYTLWIGTNPDTITPAKPDVYFYIITTYDWADRKKHHTGYVHLKR